MSTSKHRRPACAAAAVLIALTAAACGGSGGDGDSDPLSNATTRPTETFSEVPTETAAPRAAALATDTDDDLGAFLVDGAGMVLYLFTGDGEDASACYDACSVMWPPFTADTAEVPASGGADAALVGTTERTDGTLQVTYGGHPLYYYADDEEPGETDGQGFDDVWFVVNPDGTANERDE
ncbi:hypothetical protein LO763_00260 [Glycomyces sp. A-F 0318]|uniref:COG4315 family predicted lipoprotein n=1 Tax=Glycomyces amatae TaxID=2881355 RepID=UPI001E6194A5|nr:hypothetical protein [Glycomyces amatae]MCD0442059.1 hypothetical protein [Glycomyces amatae]